MKISKESSGINLVDSENSIYIWIFRVVSLFSYQGSLLSHFASAINIISNRFCFVKTFLKLFLFCCFVFTASARYILSDGDTFVNTFFHFFWFFFNICSNPRKFDIFRDFRAVLTDSPIVIRLPSIAKGYPAGGFQPDIPSLHWVLL